jgi:hypothetical protein
MDNSTLQLIAKFTIRARKHIGAIDVKLLAENETYREEVFKQVNETADEELLMISLSLRESLSTATTQASNPEENTAAPKPLLDKYLKGTRG